MKKFIVIAVVIVVAVVAGGFFFYQKDGPAEELGRSLDEGIDKLRYGDESALEKTGRKIKETAGDISKNLSD
jgi:hypothetical protein